ncbi:MAG: peptide chain release factor N(5)-glutamine methyltransferase [Candidatus Uhrbacteria bacterium]
MTIVEAIKWGNEKLKAGTDEVDNSASPLLDVQVLLAAILNTPTSYLFTHLDQTLKETELEKFRKFINRRSKKEPVAYIIGEKEFYKRSFLVNPHVLIPRPATETLIEIALNEAKKNNGECWFADIGTGSGAIAITLAAETGLPVIASDVSSEALTVAKQNMVKNKIADLIDFRHGDLLEPLIKIFQTLKNSPEKNTCTNLIVCANLPYLSHSQWYSLESNVRNFEPALALTAGHDGLDLYWRLIRDLKKSRPLFPAQLTLILEIDPDQTQKIIEIIKHDFSETNPLIFKDLEGWNRVVLVEF